MIGGRELVVGYSPLVVGRVVVIAIMVVRVALARGTSEKSLGVVPGRSNDNKGLRDCT